MAAQKAQSLLRITRRAHGRQRGEQRATIASAQQAWIADDDRPKVILAADQPADALLQSKRGFG